MIQINSSNIDTKVKDQSRAGPIQNQMDSSASDTMVSKKRRALPIRTQDWVTRFLYKGVPEPDIAWFTIKIDSHKFYIHVYDKIQAGSTHAIK